MKPIHLPVKRKYAAALALAIMVALLGTTGALAAGGALDPAFGAGGFTTTNLGLGYGEGKSVALQPDGKIVVLATGDPDGDNPGPRLPFLLRYNANGTPDTTFGTNGQLVAQTGDFRGARAAVQADGKIVVGGNYGDDFGVARYKSNGALDTTFNGTGIASIHITDGSHQDCYAVAVQQDGKIVVSGAQRIDKPEVRYAIARFTTAGQRDLTFNSTGSQIVGFPNARDNYATGLAMQTDGKIVMSGYMIDLLGAGPMITLARLNPNGTLDTTFGTGGRVVSKTAAFVNTAGLALAPNGKMVVAGTRYTGVLNDLGMARFNANGVLDLTFHGDGLRIDDFGEDEEAHAVAVQKDGKILVIGRTLNSTASAVMLVRYNTDGSLDGTFGTGGKVLSKFGDNYQTGNAVALQTDNKIVVAGSTDSNALLARYNPGTLNITLVSKTFRSVGEYDGWILESGEFTNTGGTLDKLATTINLGDDAKDRQYRSMLSFKTEPLPDTAVITGVQLKVRRQGLVGTNPFNTHGPLLSAIRQGTFSGNLALQLSDFSAPASPGSIPDRFYAVPNSTWYVATLSNGNLAYIQKVGWTQFRLQFTKDDNDDLGADYVKMFSGNAADSASWPQLIVTYFMP